MEPLLEGLLRSLGGSEASFFEVCFGRIPYGNFHTKVTSKKSERRPETFLGILRSGCHPLGVPYRHGNKTCSQTRIRFQRRVPVLSLESAHGLFGFEPTFDSLVWGCHGSGGLFGGFLRWIFIQKEYPPKKLPKNLPPENKKSIGTPAGPENLPQNLPTNPVVTAPSASRFFVIEKVCSWRRVGSMDSGALLATLWAWSRLPCWKMHLRSLSCCWWQGQGLLRTLSDATTSQRCSFWENGWPK